MESLSDYMLLEVFVRLDPASLKNCTEVCKRWNNLITQSASTMDKLTLKLDSSCNWRDLRNINRRYSNLKLSNMTVRHEAWSLFLNCQQNLRKLELNGIVITVSNSRKMVQNIPTLEELTINNCIILGGRRGGKIWKMPMLQKLTTNGCGEFCENIDGSELKKLNISENFNSKYWKRFVSSLHALEDLSLLSSPHFDDSCKCFAHAKVKLKKLKILFVTNWRDIRERGSSLVEAHAATLETLEINSVHHLEVTEYDLTSVTPSNSLSTQSFEEYYKLLVDVYSPNYSHELIASTAKYYIPQLKSMKIYRPSSA